MMSAPEIVQNDLNIALLIGCARSGTSILAEESDQQGIERCALLSRDVIQIVRADLAGVPHLQVRYEDLLAAPRERLADTWRFLGLPIDPSALNFADKIQDATAGSFHAARQDMWYREDHARRVGRWRENLSLEQQRRVNCLLADTLKSLGYERNTVRPLEQGPGIQ